MGSRQTAVNTLSYSTRSRPRAEVGQSVGKNDRNQRLRTSTPRRAPVRASAGPTVGGGWSSAKQVSSTPNQPHRGFRPTAGSDQDGNDRDVVGSHRVTTFFSLRLRVAQHFTYRLAAET